MKKIGLKIADGIAPLWQFLPRRLRHHVLKGLLFWNREVPTLARR